MKTKILLQLSIILLLFQGNYIFATSFDPNDPNIMSVDCDGDSECNYYQMQYLNKQKEAQNKAAIPPAEQAPSGPKWSAAYRKNAIDCAVDPELPGCGQQAQAQDAVPPKEPTKTTNYWGIIKKVFGGKESTPPVDAKVGEDQPAEEGAEQSGTPGNQAFNTRGGALPPQEQQTASLGIEQPQYGNEGAQTPYVGYDVMTAGLQDNNGVISDAHPGYYPALPSGQQPIGPDDTGSTNFMAGEIDGVQGTIDYGQQPGQAEASNQLLQEELDNHYRQMNELDQSRAEATARQAALAQAGQQSTDSMSQTQDQVPTVPGATYEAFQAWDAAQSDVVADEYYPTETSQGDSFEAFQSWDAAQSAPEPEYSPETSSFESGWFPEYSDGDFAGDIREVKTKRATISSYNPAESTTSLFEDIWQYISKSFSNWF